MWCLKDGEKTGLQSNQSDLVCHKGELSTGCDEYAFLGVMHKQIEVVAL